MIVDGHIHRYPPEVVEDPGEWGRRREEKHWVKLISGKGGKQSIQGWADRAKLLRDMDAAGISKAVMLGWYWEREETCRLQNKWHLEWIREDPDRLLGFATVQPLAGDTAFDDVRRALDGGLKGIGEILPAAQGFPMDHPTWLKILSMAEERGVPVTLHVTEPVGRPYPGKVETPLKDYQWLAEQFPDLKFIFAHWGGGLPFYELNPRCRKAFKNVYYDTAATPLLYEGRIFRAVADIVGAEKILFGSDYPLRIYPREQKEPDFKRLVNAVRNSGLRESELEAIFHGNIDALLKGLS